MCSQHHFKEGDFALAFHCLITFLAIILAVDAHIDARAHVFFGAVAQITL